MFRLIRRHPILATLCLLLVAGIGAGVYYLRRPKLTPVRVSPVERVEKLTAIVSASGEIRAHDVVDIQTEVPGVIVELPVVEGQRVRKGDVLLRIDPFQAEKDLAGARARFAGAQASIKRVETTIATAEANLARANQALKSAEVDLEEARIAHQRDLNSLERQRPLRAGGTISADQFELFESIAKISGKRVEAAQARIAQIQAEIRACASSVEEQRALKTATEQDMAATSATLERAMDQLGKVTIVSPIDGAIIRLNVDIGERAVPGIQSNPEATLMTIANLSLIEAEIATNETEIVRVALGHPAKVMVDALRDTPLFGHVTEIGSAPIQKRTVTSGQEGKDFKVVIAIDDPPASLRVGMSCEADITVDTCENVLAVPIQSLTAREIEIDEQGVYVAPPKPQKGKGAQQAAPRVAGALASDTGQAPAAKAKKKEERPGVFVKGADGFAHFRPVKTGIMGAGKAHVLEGLEEGESVITGPLKSLRELEEWTAVKLDDGKAGK